MKRGTDPRFGWITVKDDDTSRGRWTSNRPRSFAAADFNIRTNIFAQNGDEPARAGRSQCESGISH